LSGKIFAALPRAEAEIVRNCAGKEKRYLRDQPYPPPQLAWQELPIVLSCQVHRPPGRLIQTIEQPEEGGFARTTGPDHSQDLTLSHAYRDVIDQACSGNNAAQ